MTNDEEIHATMDEEFAGALQNLEKAIGTGERAEYSQGEALIALAKAKQAGSLTLEMSNKIARRIDRREPLTEAMVEALELPKLRRTLRKSILTSEQARHEAQRGARLLDSGADDIETLMGERRSAAPARGSFSGADQSGHEPGGGGSLFNVNRSEAREDTERETNELSADMRHRGADGRYPFYSTKDGIPKYLTAGDILRYVAEAVQAGRLDLQTASIIEMKLNHKRAIPDAMLRYICEG